MTNQEQGIKNKINALYEISEILDKEFLNTYLKNGKVEKTDLIKAVLEDIENNKQELKEKERLIVALSEILFSEDDKQSQLKDSSVMTNQEIEQIYTKKEKDLAQCKAMEIVTGLMRDRDILLDGNISYEGLVEYISLVSEEMNRIAQVIKVNYTNDDIEKLFQIQKSQTTSY